MIEAQLEGWLSRGAKRCVAGLIDGRPAPPAVLELSDAHEQPTFVLAPGHDASRLEAFAALSGALRRARGGGVEREHAHLPAIRADPFCVPELDRFLADGEIWVDAAARSALQEIREQHARAAGLVALSAATDAELEVRGLGGELKPFQRAGVSYLLERRRAFLADEQGLGKTIEALATLEADGAYPGDRRLPGEPQAQLAARARSAGSPGAARRRSRATAAASRSRAADITVVNYDIVAARLERLAGLAPRALVLDESHYCKNAGGEANAGRRNGSRAKCRARASCSR